MKLSAMESSVICYISEVESEECFSNIRDILRCMEDLNGQVEIDRNDRSVRITNGTSFDNVCDEVALLIESIGYKTHKWSSRNCFHVIKIEDTPTEVNMAEIYHGLIKLSGVENIYLNLNSFKLNMVVRSDFDMQRVFDEFKIMNYTASYGSITRNIYLQMHDLQFLRRKTHTIRNKIMSMDDIDCVMINTHTGIVHVRGGRTTTYLILSLQNDNFDVSSSTLPFHKLISDDESLKKNISKYLNRMIGISKSDMLTSEMKKIYTPPASPAQHKDYQNILNKFTSIDEVEDISMMIGDLADSRSVLQIQGLTTASRSAGLRESLLRKKGISRVFVSLIKECVEVFHDSDVVSHAALVLEISGLGIIIKRSSCYRAGKEAAIRRTFKISLEDGMVWTEHTKAILQQPALQNEAGVFTTNWYDNPNGNEVLVESLQGSDKIWLTILCEEGVMAPRSVLRALQARLPFCIVEPIIPKQNSALPKDIHTQKMVKQAALKLQQCIIIIAALTFALVVILALDEGRVSPWVLFGWDIRVRDVILVALFIICEATAFPLYQLVGKGISTGQDAKNTFFTSFSLVGSLCCGVLGKQLLSELHIRDSVGYFVAGSLYLVTGLLGRWLYLQSELLLLTDTDDSNNSSLSNINTTTSSTTSSSTMRIRKSHNQINQAILLISSHLLENKMKRDENDLSISFSIDNNDNEEYNLQHSNYTNTNTNINNNEKYHSTPHKNVHTSRSILHETTWSDMNGLMNERVVMADTLQPGDIVKILPGMICPDDGLVVYGSGDVHEAISGGTLIPVTKYIGDTIIGGAYVLSGMFHIEILAESGLRSSRCQLESLIQMHRVHRSTSTSSIWIFVVQTVLPILLSFVSVILAVGFVWSSLQFELEVIEWKSDILWKAVIIFNLALPSTLGIAIYLPLIIASWVIAPSLGIKVRHPSALRTLREVTTVVFGKSGVLSVGRLEVNEVKKVILGNPSPCTSTSNINQLSRSRKSSLTSMSIDIEILNTIRNSTFDELQTPTVGTPFILRQTSGMILNGGYEKGLDDGYDGAIEELPVEKILWLAASAELKSDHFIGKALVRYASLKPSIPALLDPDSVLCLSDCGGVHCQVSGLSVLVGSVSFLVEWQLALTQKTWSELSNISIKATEDGSMVVFIVVDGLLVGMVYLSDHVRREAKVAVTDLLNEGLDVWMTTTDGSSNAFAVGSQAGIPHSHIVSTALPSYKLQLIRNLQQDGQNILFVGRVIGDAPGLSQADVSMTIGLSSPAEDLISIDLLITDLSQLIYTIRLSQLTAFCSIFMILLIIMTHIIALFSLLWGFKHGSIRLWTAIIVSYSGIGAITYLLIHNGEKIALNASWSPRWMSLSIPSETITTSIREIFHHIYQRLLSFRYTSTSTDASFGRNTANEAEMTSLLQRSQSAIRIHSTSSTYSENQSGVLGITSKGTTLVTNEQKSDTDITLPNISPIDYVTYGSINDIAPTSSTEGRRHKSSFIIPTLNSNGRRSGSDVLKEVTSVSDLGDIEDQSSQLQLQHPQEQNYNFHHEDNLSVIQQFDSDGINVSSMDLTAVVDAYNRRSCGITFTSLDSDLEEEILSLEDSTIDITNRDVDSIVEEISALPRNNLPMRRDSLRGNISTNTSNAAVVSLVLSNPSPMDLLPLRPPSSMNAPINSGQIPTPHADSSIPLYEDAGDLDI